MKSTTKIPAEVRVPIHKLSLAVANVFGEVPALHIIKQAIAEQVECEKTATAMYRTAICNLTVKILDQRINATINSVVNKASDPLERAMCEPILSLCPGLNNSTKLARMSVHDILDGLDEYTNLSFDTTTFYGTNLYVQSIRRLGDIDEHSEFIDELYTRAGYSEWELWTVENINNAFIRLVNEGDWRIREWEQYFFKDGKYVGDKFAFED